MKLKKIAQIFLLVVLIFSLPTGAFAEAKQLSVKEEAYTQHTRIPITLIPIADGNTVSAAKSRVDGYVDFWSEVEGKKVYANWKVTITTPKAFIVGVDINVKWGIGLIGRTVKFKYPTFGVPTFVANQAENTFESEGTYFATISGSVSTTKGNAYTVAPGTIKFTVK
ncbi:hypothetical protein NLX71_09465 [Paenibacillus sp. MZ04-78.2]|uniref:hypothetical protein n=1 Tax=Paenibacillus sp. MZ04-78.2 TaxID=2962034 RepID=UPI0020B698F5|nr:hypothetical protein [Paenibacillus sp. MZ04-78.2]MCP3773538.1 hypothetical protein [Paenibacillus sp. MZ04-78.2]